MDEGTKAKLTVEITTKSILTQRAGEDAVSMGTYLDRLIARDDLRRRIAADRAALAAAGLDSPERVDRIGAAAVRSRRPELPGTQATA